MSDTAIVISTIAGALLVATTLREMLHELFRPGGSGSLSRAGQRLLWRGFRAVARRHPSSLVIAGPLIMVGTVSAWTLALTVGWALIIWPRLPTGFRFSAPLVPGAQDGFLDALYISIAALTTVGFGDITPTWPVLRLLAGLEAALGFGLLTASISWILAVYPVVSRRRAFAEELWLLHEERQVGRDVLELSPVVASRALAGLATTLARVRVDLVQSSVSYYFVDRDDPLSLPKWLPFARQLGEEGMDIARAPEIRHAGSALRRSVDTYLCTVREGHLKGIGDDPGEMLRAYAADHLREARAG